MTKPTPAQCPVCGYKPSAVADADSLAAADVGLTDADKRVLQLIFKDETKSEIGDRYEEGFKDGYEEGRDGVWAATIELCLEAVARNGSDWQTTLAEIRAMRDKP
jgi:hypothetical protein